VAMQRERLAAARGDLSAALVAANRAIELAGAANSEAMMTVRVFTNRADLELEMQRVAEAKADAAQAAERARQTLTTGSPSSYAGGAYLALGRALLATDEIAPAREALATAVEQLRPTLGPGHARTRLADALAARAASGGNEAGRKTNPAVRAYPAQP